MTLVLCFKIISYRQIIHFQGGFYLFNICDTYAGGFPRLFIGLFELAAIMWVYGKSVYPVRIRYLHVKEIKYRYTIIKCFLGIKRWVIQVSRSNDLIDIY